MNYDLFKSTSFRFAIVAVYIDDMNIIDTLDELREIAECLKFEFEMKDLRKTLFCLGLELEHCDSRFLIHQSFYIQKMLR
jgi:hypothetical protein